MAGRTSLRAFVVAMAVLVAGCSQPPPEGADSHAADDLGVIARMPVDERGAEVTPQGGGPAADPAGDGKADCPPVTLAMAGPLTGLDATFGSNIRNGAELAVERHNAANPGCQVQLTTFDTGGDPEKAAAIAPQIVDDSSIVGIVGPTWSGETKATGTIFDQAGLVAITPSATSVTLSESGWRTFFRGLSSDGLQGRSLAGYLTNDLGVKKACVVDDSTEAGRGQIRVIAETLGPVVAPGCTISIRKGDRDLSAAVAQIMDASPDAVIYAAYHTEGALLIAQLRQAGFKGLFAGPDGLRDPQFVIAAGAAAKGTVISCPCGPAPSGFADNYTKEFGQAPGTYSVEAYDAATILLAGIDSGAVTRPALLDFVSNYSGQGLARSYRWTDTGELTSNLIWIYTVQ